MAEQTSPQLALQKRCVRPLSAYRVATDIALTKQHGR